MRINLCLVFKISGNYFYFCVQNSVWIKNTRKLPKYTKRTTIAPTIYNINIKKNQAEEKVEVEEQGEEE